MIYHRVVEIALAVCVLMSGNELLAFATDFSGPVISVLDGDTIEVLHNHDAFASSIDTLAHFVRAHTLIAAAVIVGHAKIVGGARL